MIVELEAPYGLRNTFGLHRCRRNLRNDYSILFLRRRCGGRVYIAWLGASIARQLEAGQQIRVGGVAHRRQLGAMCFVLWGKGSPFLGKLFAGGLFVWRKPIPEQPQYISTLSACPSIASPTHQLGQRVAHERNPMSDFIYDDQGKCVAWIVQGDVFSETTRQKIATIRDGSIFDFSGNLVGHLQDVGFVRKGGDSTPPEFTRLLS